MTIRTRTARDGTRRLFIDIRHTTPNGREIRVRRDAKIQTRVGARAEERRLLLELDESASMQPAEKSPAVSSYVFADVVRHWRLMRAPMLKPSTRDGYDARIDRVLLPRFGAVPLSEIRGKAGGTRDGKSLEELDLELVEDGLAATTRNGIHIAFRALLRHAVDAGMLAALPSMPRLPKRGKKKRQPMYSEDLAMLLAVSSESARLAFALAAYAGLRAGEVRGLRWSDVDLVGNGITVRRSIWRGEECSPKSGDHRLIPIASPLRVLLDRALKSKRGPWSAVALTKSGEAWGQSGLTQAFARAHARAGLAGWSFHSLRAYFASELGRRGVSPAVIQRLMGHAELSTTELYIDVGERDLRTAIAELGATNGATREKELEGAR